MDALCALANPVESNAQSFKDFLDSRLGSGSEAAEKGSLKVDKEDAE